MKVKKKIKKIPEQMFLQKLLGIYETIVTKLILINTF